MGGFKSLSEISLMPYLFYTLLAGGMVLAVGRISRSRVVGFVALRRMEEDRAASRHESSISLRLIRAFKLSCGWLLNQVCTVL